MATSTDDKIIDVVIEVEGDSKATNDPSDRGGRTQYGISERSHPEAWADGKVTHDEARTIYEAKYLVGPGYDKIQSERLRHLLVDTAVHSGPSTATSLLQGILRVERDGILGPATLAAANGYPDPKRLVNLLALARLKMLGRLITDRPANSRFAAGWVSRCCEFIIP